MGPVEGGVMPKSDIINGTLSVRYTSLVGWLYSRTMTSSDTPGDVKDPLGILKSKRQKGHLRYSDHQGSCTKALANMELNCSATLGLW